MKMPKYIKSHKDLITQRQAICLGFLEQAKEKSKRATPLVEEGKQLLEELHKAKNIDQVIKTVSIEKLAPAVGLSEKAQTKFSDAELRELVKNVIESIIKKVGDGFREELLYRFLLTRGDTLGGMMRNVTGAAAAINFTGSIVTLLNVKRKKAKIITSAKQESKIKSIEWGDRILLFDRKPKFMDKNIDVILLKKPGSLDEEKLIEDINFYVSCGELKGGIDPAGADEHWKTARSALDRIREKFKGRCPNLFFAANAIEESMAGEIFSMLSSGQLAHAANLNYKEQLEDLTDWLTSL